MRNAARLLWTAFLLFITGIEVNALMSWYAETSLLVLHFIYVAAAIIVPGFVGVVLATVWRRDA